MRRSYRENSLSAVIIAHVILDMPTLKATSTILSLLIDELQAQRVEACAAPRRGYCYS